MLNFNEIYKQNYASVLSYVKSKVHNMENAEDITSAIFIRVNKYNESYDEKRSAFGARLRTMTNQCIIDFIRTQPVNYKSVSDFVNPETGEAKFDFISGTSSEANFRVENSEMHRKIRKALRNLKPQYKKIALLYFVQDLKYDEIAEICDVPMGTVKGMIKRVREQLQSELKGQYNVRELNVHEPIEYVDYMSYDEFYKVGQK